MRWLLLPFTLAFIITASTARATETTSVLVAQASLTNESKAACLRAYQQGVYRKAIAICKGLVFQMLPQLAAIRESKNADTFMRWSYDMLRITYPLAMAETKLGLPDVGRQDALHTCGWAIYIFGIREESDPKHNNATYAEMAKEAASYVRIIEQTYPGTMDQEMKAMKQLSGS